MTIEDLQTYQLMKVFNKIKSEYDFKKQRIEIQYREHENDLYEQYRRETSIKIMNIFPVPKIQKRKVWINNIITNIVIK